MRHVADEPHVADRRHVARQQHGDLATRRRRLQFEGGGGQINFSLARANALNYILACGISSLRYPTIPSARYDAATPPAKVGELSILAGGQTRMNAAVLAEITAPTMGALGKIRYSHADMIDYIIANPGTSQNALAARYGYTPSWISNVMASDAWQSAMAKRRAEIVDPSLVATVDERFRALTERSLTRLMEKLDQPVVSDNVVLKAVELGAKAMGVGGNAPPAAPAADHLAKLANRLLDLQADVRKRISQEGALLEAEIYEVSSEPQIIHTGER